MSNYTKDWSFKETESHKRRKRDKADRFIAKETKKRGKQKPKKQKSFYQCDKWLRLRYRVLAKYGATCMCCGRTRRDGLQMHVDHIKPKSKHPELALCFDNLQVLCSECNVGKLHLDSTDWRTEEEVERADKHDLEELEIVAEARNRIG